MTTAFRLTASPQALQPFGERSKTRRSPLPRLRLSPPMGIVRQAAAVRPGRRRDRLAAAHHAGRAHRPSQQGARHRPRQAGRHHHFFAAGRLTMASVKEKSAALATMSPASTCRSPGHKSTRTSGQSPGTSGNFTLCKGPEELANNGLFGAPGRTRTCDHELRRHVLYPAELRAPGRASIAKRRQPVACARADGEGRGWRRRHRR